MALDSIACVDTDRITEKGFNNLVFNSVNNAHIYKKEFKNIWLGFPKEVKNDTQSSDSESSNKPFTTPKTPFHDK